MTLPAADRSAKVELRGLLVEVQAAAISRDPACLKTAVQRLRATLELDVAAERSRLGMALVADLEAGATKDSTRPCLIRLAELAPLRPHQAALEQGTSSPLALDPSAR